MVNSPVFNPYGTQTKKRTLGQRDKQILWSQANHKCQNPYCPRKGKHIEFNEMQIGHKTAFSRGGNTTLKNSVCLCYSCNKLQGTDSWEKFLKKQAQAKIQGELRKPRTKTPKSISKTPRSRQPRVKEFNPFAEPKFKEPKWDNVNLFGKSKNPLGW